jgi:hypothetical protein
LRGDKQLSLLLHVRHPFQYRTSFSCPPSKGALALAAAAARAIFFRSGEIELCRSLTVHDVRLGHRHLKFPSRRSEVVIKQVVGWHAGAVAQRPPHGCTDAGQWERTKGYFIRGVYLAGGPSCQVVKGSVQFCHLPLWGYDIDNRLSSLCSIFPFLPSAPSSVVFLNSNTTYSVFDSCAENSNLHRVASSVNR